MSASDPFVVVSVNRSGAGGVKVDDTEGGKDCAAPNFAKAIAVEYFFEEVQVVRLQVWDYDDGGRHDALGAVEVPLGRIMGSRGAVWTAPLTGGAAGSGAGRHPATITVRGVPQSDSTDRLRLTLGGARLAAKDSGFMGIGGKSDPYFIIHRLLPDGTKLVVSRSTVVSKNLNPTWPPVDIPINDLCGGALDALTVVVEVWDWDAASAHDLIGVTAPLSVNALLAAATTKAGFPLVEPAKAGKRGYTDSGQLVVAGTAVIRVPSFLEYIAGGCQINMMVAVDFTGSNGNPLTPGSLHYIGDRSVPTQYLQALAACGAILLEYDSDKMVPAYGFGGMLPDRTTSHCFALNGNPAAPEVAGVEGLTGAYWQALMNVGLSGPTYFEPIMRAAATAAAAPPPPGSPPAAKYTVLLLLTDGQFNDMEATVAAVVAASATPLSIVIVGIGDADFSGMEMLDADRGPLRSGYTVAERDIVQFVPFRAFRGGGPAAGAELARAVLREVPGQLVAYFLCVLGRVGGTQHVSPPPPPSIPAATHSIMQEARHSADAAARAAGSARSTGSSSSASSGCCRWGRGCRRGVVRACRLRLVFCSVCAKALCEAQCESVRVAADPTHVMAPHSAHTHALLTFVMFQSRPRGAPVAVTTADGPATARLLRVTRTRRRIRRGDSIPLSQPLQLGTQNGRATAITATPAA